MGDVISKFERLINRINVVYGLIIPVSLMTLSAIGLWGFHTGYFQHGSLPIYIVIITSVAMVFAAHLRSLNRLSLRQVQTLYGFYHLALISFCVFVAPFLSPFEFLWVVLAIGMDLIFKRSWMYLTFVLYIATLGIVIARTHVMFDSGVFLTASVQVFGVISTSLLVSMYRRVSDDERKFLDSASRETDFERQRLLSLINNMGEAVVATDKRGRVLIYNAAVLNLLDTNQSLEGKSLDAVLSLKDKSHNKVKLSALLEKSPIGLTTTDYRHEFGPNDAINIYLNIAPIKLGFRQAAESGYIMLMRDITKEKSLEDERDEFISVVSHELRTPVAIAEGNISNAIFMNGESHDPAIILKSLDQAHQQVMFLASMINDLASLSRAERTDTKLELGEVDPKEFIHAIARDYKPEAATKKLTLTVSAAQDVKPIVTSELYLHEILQNFVTNAIKYTKKGTVLVHVRSNKSGDAVFSVADSGIGLSKSDQKRVFDKFFRSEDYRTRESSGTGLGLYVTAKLATRLNAQIALESELNKGTTFTITIPSLSIHPKHH